MRRRAWRGIVEVVGIDSVVHVRLMIGAVKVLSIPASRPSEYTCIAWSKEVPYGGKWWVVKIPPEHGLLGMSDCIVPLLPPDMHW